MHRKSLFSKNSNASTCWNTVYRCTYWNVHYVSWHVKSRMLEMSEGVSKERWEGLTCKEQSCLSFSAINLSPSLSVCPAQLSSRAVVTRIRALVRGALIDRTLALRCHRNVVPRSFTSLTRASAALVARGRRRRWSWVVWMLCSQPMDITHRTRQLPQPSSAVCRYEIYNFYYLSMCFPNSVSAVA